MYINKKVELILNGKQKYFLEQWFLKIKYVQNLYLKANLYSYDKYKNDEGNKNKRFVNAYSFDKWLTQYSRKKDGEWLNPKKYKKYLTKDSYKRGIKDVENGYKKFFQSKSKGERVGKPKFKGKNYTPRIYFVGKCVKITSNAIKVPKIGWLCLKERNYLPIIEDGVKVKSGSITKSSAGKYYVSVMIELSDDYFYDYDKPYSEPLGIDLGVKDTAILSNGTKYGNINKTEKIKREEKHLKHLQRDLSRKYEARKKEFAKQPKEKKIVVKWYKSQLKRIKQLKEYRIKLNRPKQAPYVKTPMYTINIQTYDLINAQDKVRFVKNKMTMSNNWYKTKVKVAKLHERLTNQRTYYQEQIISDIIKLKPMYITLEDLNISAMMKNKHMAKAISQQKLYELKTKLIAKCEQHGIEVREVDRFYPSSQICSECGEQYKWLGCENKNQMLRVREWECPNCGTHHDRDINAAINLRNAEKYKVSTNFELGCAYKK